ncbi:MAG: hypothetical protein UT38_C0018G0004 [Microgenomates group bacterium GW2011_GWA2_39_19]|nr:MAG: hypothetical protein UT38_C0018G0004 [Microgenomates group bacterium GW2011_GWA2_39_19]
MKLSLIRDLKSLRLVLKDPEAVGPDPAYWVFSEIGGLWNNITLIAPGNYNGEFPKTFGHYHETHVNEKIHVIEGKGVMLLQKRLVENGNPISEKIEEVICIKAKAGDEIIVPFEYGHSWYNTGDEPLILFDDWSAGHVPGDYKEIGRLQGMAYYITDNNGIDVLKNSNYTIVPQIKWLTVEEFSKRRLPK